MRARKVVICLFHILIAPCMGVAHADNLSGFWQTGVVNNPAERPQANSSKDIVFADRPKAVVIAEQQPPEAAAQPQPPANTQPQSPVQPVSAQAPAARDEIYKKYGPPTVDLPVRAIKDAPTALQALFECVHIGDTQCSIEYAEQMARFQDQMRETVSKVTEYQLLGQEAAGIRRPPSDAEEEGEVSPERLAVAKYLEEAQKRIASKKLTGKAPTDGEGINEESDVKSKDQLFQPKPTGPVPVDPEGKATLLVFFKEGPEALTQLNDAVKPLKSLLKPDGSVKILGLTNRTYSKTGLRRVSAQTSFPFSLVNGEALSKELLITKYPTFVFVAPTSKETYRLEGLRDAGEIEKVIRLMQGGK
jgi:hypothetical protein